MPVYKDEKRDTWYAKFQTTDPRTGAHKQVLKRGFATKREAVIYEAKHRTDGTDLSHMAFDELFQEYLMNTDASATARSMKASWIRLHFPLHTETMQALTRPALVDWRNSLKDTMAVRTINRGLGYVRGVCKYAYDTYGIPDNGVVIKNYKLTKQDKQEHPVWTPDEFNQFLSYVDGEYYRAFFTYLYWTGCRRGEGMALCKDDIQGNKVHIWRAIKHYKNGFLPLKTDTSERTISLDRRTLEFLKPCIDRADPFVFGGIRSLPISNIQREFTSAIERSGVHPIVLHDLRHSHATLLINNGVNIVAVSKRLGHASVDITMKVYAHLLKESDDALVAKLDEIHE